MKQYKFILFILISFLISTVANAAEIVYPKTKEAKIISPVTFFIGNEKSKNKLTINGEEVKIHESGGFYHVVYLNPGKNVFVIDNGIPSEKKTYTIIRPVVKYSSTKNAYKNYTENKYFCTKTDNSPLRSAPNEDGLNRLEHLQKNIPLTIIGEQGNYYKIKLARDDYAWIGKDYAINCQTNNDKPAEILSYTYEENGKERIFTLKLDKKTPYILSETRSFELKDSGYEPYADGLDLIIYNVKDMPENKYEFHINSETNLFGYKAEYNDANELVITVKNQPKISAIKPLKGLNITVDAGHGGSEYGAIGCLGDKEKDINLKIALYTKEALEKAGANVFLTRDKDEDMGLYERVDFSKKHNSDVFISIHSNALPDTLANSNRSGTSVYYFYPQSNNLAGTILDTMIKNLSTNNDKVRQDSFAVIRNHESLSILIEVGYMIVPEDNAKLINDDFQKKAGYSIAKGLEKYFSEIK